MKRPIQVLYISWDGLTDPLGNYQILPYLTKLSGKKFEIHVVSLEKKLVYNKNYRETCSVVNEFNIFWSFSYYKNKITGLSTLVNFFKILMLSIKVCRKNNIKFSHGRGYIPTWICYILNILYSCPFIFDMRGFWADEKVEGGNWNLKNPMYFITYKTFKKMEKVLLCSADHIVCLTFQAKIIVESWIDDENCQANIDVIPCCANLSHFNYKKYDKKYSLNKRMQLSIKDKNKVICYLGSLGSWYMIDEMLDFFIEFKISYEDSTFLIITPEENTHLIYASARKKSVNIKDMCIVSSSYSDVPSLISVADIAISFIRPTFSKKASSPTKIGELLGMGIPIVSNVNIGDLSTLFRDFKCGIKVDNFTKTAYKNAVNSMDCIFSLPMSDFSDAAHSNFSLTHGVKVYRSIYSKLAK